MSGEGVNGAPRGLAGRSAALRDRAAAHLSTLAARPIARQFAVFVQVGLLATAVHYGVLYGLVERLGVEPVRASLAGFVLGGFVSYALNRRLTYASDRPHAEATWRFVLVSGVAFGLTWMLMAGLTRRLGLPYLPSQVGTTGTVLVWNFLANRHWTFATPA